MEPLSQPQSFTVAPSKFQKADIDQWKDEIENNIEMTRAAGRMPAFLSQQAPENYVAGLGRGATGFTTRSDLGPAREGPTDDEIREALEKRSRQANGEEKDDDKNGDDQDPENEMGLFAGSTYDKDDEEADRIWASIDAKMDKRRKRARYVNNIFSCLSFRLCSLRA